ncbi:MAG: S-layer homology domain-containing protein [Lachnospiraceae bacterium]|nr:S-layer homology domain-containing protein [Lachnospiraceae bacterium]
MKTLKFGMPLILVTLIIASMTSVYAYSDVPADAWYNNAVTIVTEFKMMNGYGNDLFGPTDKFTIAQVCKVALSDTIKSSKLTLENDTSSSYWAYNYIKTCIDNDIIPYLGEITPENYDVPATRELAVATIMRSHLYNSFFSADRIFDCPDIDLISEENREVIRYAYATKIISGVDAAGTFNPNGLISRAEIAQILVNYIKNNPFVTDFTDLSELEGEYTSKDSKIAKMTISKNGDAVVELSDGTIENWKFNMHGIVTISEKEYKFTTSKSEFKVSGIYSANLTIRFDDKDDNSVLKSKYEMKDASYGMSGFEWTCKLVSK